MQTARIREAVCAHHGGFENASDAQIRKLWSSLGAEVQKRYLDNLKTERKKDDAIGDQTGQKGAGSSQHR